jgi:surfeit locus 1 family protein
MAPLRKLLIPTLGACAALAVLLNLGFWQLDRLAWKENLIRQVEAGVTADPVPAPGPDRWEDIAEPDDYLRVEVRGRYLPGTVFYYTALADAAGPLNGPGVMVYAPFRTEGGWTVLVNRGFLPQGLPPEPREKALAAPGGDLILTGLLRLGETPNWTTPAPDQGDRIWFARDTADMGAALNVPPSDLAPYSIDLGAAHTPGGGLPQAGETVVRFKNDHLGYALTWFGLAATLVGVFLTYAASILWPRRREG